MWNFEGDNDVLQFILGVHGILLVMRLTQKCVDWVGMLTVLILNLINYGYNKTMH